MLLPCEGCNDYCWSYCGRCSGKGYILTLGIGLGQHGLVPSYVQTVCLRCCGEGKIFCIYC
jgi:hypothetical protein